MISSHKYQQQIALHEKCLAILNLKLKAIRYLDNARESLHEYINAKDRYAPIRLYNTKDTLQDKIAWYEKVVQRITSYYRKHSLQLCRLMAEVEDYDQKVQRIKSFALPDIGAVHYLGVSDNLISQINYGTAELTSHLPDCRDKILQGDPDKYHVSFESTDQLNPQDINNLFHGKPGEDPSQNIPSYR